MAHLLLNNQNESMRRYAEELREISRVIESIDDGITLSDKKGHFELFNLKMQEITGYSIREANRQEDFNLLIHPEARNNPGMLKSLGEITAGKGYHETEITIRTKDGLEKIVLVSTSLIRYKDQDMFLSVYRDITDRKSLEMNLLISENRYRGLFEAAQDGILILDTNTGMISDVNPFLMGMLGYSKEEFLSKKLWEIGAFSDTQTCKDVFLRLQTEGYVRYEDLPLKTKEGRPIEVEFISNVYKISDGLVAQCNIRDITKRKREEEVLKEYDERLKSTLTELEVAYDELQKIDRMKSDFVSIVSHELRTPLTSIKNAVTILLSDGMKKNSVDQKERELLDIISVNTDRQTRLISDLLDISKIEMGVIEMDIKCEDVVGLAKDVIDHFRVQTSEKNIKLDMTATQSSIPVFIDREQIRRVFNNLIDNAAKFTPNNGEIDVKIEKLDAAIKVTVSDTGIGVSEEDAGKIFDKFQMIRKAETRNKGGTGLGLAIAKGIVEAHGGGIFVESQLEKGTSFCFTLPEQKKGVRYGEKKNTHS